MREAEGRVVKRKAIRWGEDFTDAREMIRKSFDNNSFVSFLQNHKFISWENPGIGSRAYTFQMFEFFIVGFIWLYKKDVYHDNRLNELLLYGANVYLVFKKGPIFILLFLSVKRSRLCMHAQAFKEIPKSSV